MPAPIVLFCYNRPKHLLRTLESLKQNTIASESQLIIFSDGPKRDKDIPRVKLVRRILHSITGFKTVTINESRKNKGLANSVISGINSVFQSFNEAIVMEDDLVCTPDFLEYMNQSLKTYKGRNDIFSVTGYSPPIKIPHDYKQDVYMAQRTCSWGWGTWKNRWEKAVWKVPDINTLNSDKTLKQKLIKGGDDLWQMLIDQQLGLIDSWAIRWAYSQSLQEAYSIYLVDPKIKNIGTDGSGIHYTTAVDLHQKELVTKKVKLDFNLQPDSKIEAIFAGHGKLPLLLKIKNYIRSLIKG